MNQEQPFSAAGGCACGALRYRLTRQPLFVNCCHCTWCQRQSGAAFALNAMLETSHIVSLGEAPQAMDIPTPSGKGQRLLRCAKCGVVAWSHYATAGDALGFIRVGTLDEAHRFPPNIHFFTDSKQPWVTLAEGVPAVGGNYKVHEYFPQPSLQRWQALFSSAGEGGKK